MFVLVIVLGVEWPPLRDVVISSANAARLRHPNVQQPPFGGGRIIDFIAKTFHVGPLLNPERSAAAADRNVAPIIFPPHPCQLVMLPVPHAIVRDVSPGAGMSLPVDPTTAIEADHREKRLQRCEGN